MAVSGTYNFNLDIDEVIQEATEMICGEDTLGHEPASARRSINLMLKDWQNRGILLWTTNTTLVTVSVSTTAYDLSSNVINALQLSKNIGCKSIGLSGKSGGDMNKLCDVNLVIPANDTARIQEMHILVGHIICHLIELECKNSK